MKQKQQLLSLFMALCMAFLILPISSMTALGADGNLEGEGSADSPYQIADAQDLLTFAELVNGGDADACAALTANLDLGGSDSNPWIGIGPNNSQNYNGTFDGRGFEISGLYVNSSNSYQGLFGFVGVNGTVMNLKVSGEVVTTNQQAGGVAGHSKGKLVNCASSVNVTGKTAVGGVVGWNAGTVERCSYRTGTVTDTGSYSGGVVGYNEGAVSNSFNTGTIKGTNYVGGVVGSNGGKVENCYNVGAVSGVKEVGGVVGFKFATATNCYFLADEPTQEIKGGGTGKTVRQFASGEVAWLLNSGVTDATQPFYQTCGEGNPAFAGKTVYQVTSYQCPGDTVGQTAYSNTNQNITGEHSFTNETAIDEYLKTAGTCISEAVYYKSCAICGEASAADTFQGDKDALNHTNLVKTDAKAATHMAEGNIAYWYCDGCGKYFSDQAGSQQIALADTVLPKLSEHSADESGWHSDENKHWNTCECGEMIHSAAHTFAWITDKEATKTTAGSKHEECTVCGYAKAAVEIPAAGTISTPATGENASFALLILLLSGVGFILTGSVVYNRRKRSR